MDRPHSLQLTEGSTVSGLLGADWESGDGPGEGLRLAGGGAGAGGMEDGKVGEEVEVGDDGEGVEAGGVVVEKNRMASCAAMVRGGGGSWFFPVWLMGSAEGRVWNRTEGDLYWSCTLFVVFLFLLLQ